MRFVAIACAAAVYAGISVYCVRLAAARRRMGVLHGEAHRSFRRAALTGAFLAGGALVAESYAAATSPADESLGAYVRIVAWAPLFLLLIGQAAFLRRDGRAPVAWLVLGIGLAALTIPPALRRA